MVAIPDIGTARVRWVDVFATGPLTGNPLAVVLCQRMPPPLAMQQMAAEFGLSETVFAVRSDPPRVRIFTPTTEIPMAGHPLVGAAWVLRDEGWITDEAVLAAAGGDVPVAVDSTTAWMTPPAPQHVGDVNAAELAAALGTASDGVAPIWDAGMPQVMLSVDDPMALTPNHHEIAALGIRDGWCGVSACAIERIEGRTAVVRVRHFAQPIGIPEDPVTGSAAGALGAALVAAGHGVDGVLRLTIHQGHAMGRLGEVLVFVDAPTEGPMALRVGGRVLPVMTGAIE